MEGLIDHIKRLHNKELIFNDDESQRFSQMLMARNRPEHVPINLSQHAGKLKSLRRKELEKSRGK